MHSCDTPLCVNPAHLIAGTQKQNIHDMLLKSRQRTAETYIKQSGEKAWNSVLTNKQAIAIRQEYARGHTSWLKLARKYGVAKKTIGNIIQGVTYVNC